MNVPTPPLGKPVAIYDTECFPNYWLLKIRVRNGPVFSFRVRAGESFDQFTCKRIEYLFTLFTVISFNGIYYDVPMIAAALCGFTCEQLKWVNDQIIVEQKKPWELGLSTEWRPPDHIDLMEVLPGAASQKQYAGRIHCKTMRDLPYSPDAYLSETQIIEVDSYCENDLSVLEELYDACGPALSMREHASKKYGIDLRSKSDAQFGEAIIKKCCETAIGARIFKPEIDWNIRFRYQPPAFLSFQDERLKAAFDAIKQAIFTLGPSGAVVMPSELDALEIPLGKVTYRLGIGGLHSKDEKSVRKSNEEWVIRDCDVRSYYPNLILNSGKYPAALGPVYREVYQTIVNERIEGKHRQKELEKQGLKGTPEWLEAQVENEGKKIAVNGPFGKLGSPFSILFAPEMLIQTTVTGQLALLMLIEWFGMQGIEVISANTDGVIVFCERSKLPIVESIIAYWQKVTGLEMETGEYRAVYSRDVNNYFAIKLDGTAKRKGEYSTAGLIEKKNPDAEICADAVAEFLSKGTPILYTVAACRDIRKFVKIQKVAGGAVKLWGEGPRKNALVREMEPVLIANGWTKAGLKWTNGGRKWTKGEQLTDAVTAYKSCFDLQRPEYLGKVVRFYYGTHSPGSIIYNTNGNTVGLSYGAQPCMILPDELPGDIDYRWYLESCEKMLRDVGYYS